MTTKQRQQHQPDAPFSLPDEFETADTKLVYLYLRVETEATIDELHTALGMKKLTLYPLLRRLTTTDLVDREGAKYVYQTQSPARGAA